MSQRRKFRRYIALALFVAYPALLIYGPTAVQRLVPPACLVTTIALLFWRFPSRLPGLLQISDLRLYIALALFVAYAALLIYGPTPVERRLVGLAYVLATVALLFWPQSFPRRDRF
jgi:uncharacterized protein (DUF486 family)